MAAYTAVISLLQALEQLQQRHPELVQGQTAKILESLRDTAEYFQNVIEEASKRNDIVHGLDDDLEIIVERLKEELSDLDIVTIRAGSMHTLTRHWP
ncbi:hypothetical protein KY284_000257 [Solanum tuberosum]|nr:hypothetical protein KY284_000257 [Solanum tuberosum]